MTKSPAKRKPDSGINMSLDMGGKLWYIKRYSMKRWDDEYFNYNAILGEVKEIHRY